MPGTNPGLEEIKTRKTQLLSSRSLMSSGGGRQAERQLHCSVLRARTVVGMVYSARTGQGVRVALCSQPSLTTQAFARQRRERMCFGQRGYRCQSHEGIKCKNLEFPCGPVG